jgi:radical SAM superfamily enzyme YgiQ (UPF0313 family)
LVGAAVGDFNGIGELCSAIRSSGGDVSVASLRIDALDDEMIRVLVESGHRTVSLAPEGPSQRLRDLVRKGISTEQILEACERLISRDILNLKLYFIVGLPTETIADLEEMAGLVEEIRKLVTVTAKGNRRLGKLILSVNPFVPKPFTPFQWCGMAPAKYLEGEMKFMLKIFSSMPNVKLQMEGVKEAIFQALLSRGDRRLGRVLVSAVENGNWKRALKECGFNLEKLVTREIPLNEVLPWDLIYCGNRERLENEYRKALE